MYIQSNNSGEGAPLQLPRDYSGSAFSPPVPGNILQSAQEQQEIPADNRDMQEKTEMPSPPVQEEVEAPTPLRQNGAEAPAFAPFSKAEGSVWGKLPFLSAFLPPPRKKGSKRGEKEGGFLEGIELFDWILIGAALLLFFTDNTDDILPLLLLLLLWD